MLGLQDLQSCIRVDHCEWDIDRFAGGTICVKKGIFVEDISEGINGHEDLLEGLYIWTILCKENQ